MEINKTPFSFIKTDGVSIDEVKELKINKPSVIMFGGNPTINIDEAMRNLSVAQSIIGRKFILKNFNKFDIYSVYYNKGYVLSQNYYLNGKYTEEDFSDLSETIFSPLVMNKYGRLSAQEAGENFKKVVIFAHSAGALVVDNVLRELTYNLYLLGYSKKDINYLLNQITFMAYSPYSVIHYPISSIYITPINDSLNSWMRTLLLKENKEEWSIDFADIEYKKMEFQNILKRHDFISYIGKVSGSKFLNITTAPLRKDFGEDHSFAGILKNQQGRFPYASETGKNTGELMQFFLQSMIEKSMKRKKTITNNDFLDALQAFLKIYANEKAKQRLINQLSEKAKKQVFIELLKEFFKEEMIKILEEEMKKNTKDKKEDEWTN